MVVLSLALSVFQDFAIGNSFEYLTIYNRVFVVNAFIHVSVVHVSVTVFIAFVVRFFIWDFYVFSRFLCV